MAEKKSGSTNTAGGGTKKTASGKTATGGKEKSMTELVGTLAEKAGITKAQAKQVLEAHAEMLIDELKQNGSVQLAGIGKLKLGQRAERQGRNPATGEARQAKP
jgi:nucleoid DNA-binding protein